MMEFMKEVIKHYLSMDFEATVFGLIVILMATLAYLSFSYAKELFRIRRLRQRILNIKEGEIVCFSTQDDDFHLGKFIKRQNFLDDEYRAHYVALKDANDMVFSVAPVDLHFKIPLDKIPKQELHKFRKIEIRQINEKTVKIGDDILSPGVMVFLKDPDGKENLFTFVGLCTLSGQTVEESLVWLNTDTGLLEQGLLGEISRVVPTKRQSNDNFSWLEWPDKYRGFIVISIRPREDSEEIYELLVTRGDLSSWWFIYLGEKKKSLQIVWGQRGPYVKLEDGKVYLTEGHWYEITEKSGKKMTSLVTRIEEKDKVVYLQSPDEEHSYWFSEDMDASMIRNMTSFHPYYDEMADIFLIEKAGERIRVSWSNASRKKILSFIDLDTIWKNKKDWYYEDKKLLPGEICYGGIGTKPIIFLPEDEFFCFGTFDGQLVMRPGRIDPTGVIHKASKRLVTSRYRTVLKVDSELLQELIRESRIFFNENGGEKTRILWYLDDEGRTQKLVVVVGEALEESL